MWLFLPWDITQTYCLNPLWDAVLEEDCTKFLWPSQNLLTLQLSTFKNGSILFSYQLPKLLNNWSIQNLKLFYCLTYLNTTLTFEALLYSKIVPHFWKSSLLIVLLIDLTKIRSIFGQSTKVRFASFLSGRFNTVAVIDSPEKKLAKHNSVQWSKLSFNLV